MKSGIMNQSVVECPDTNSISNYFIHMKCNFSVTLKCLKFIGRQSILASFHLAHGLVPVKYTSHEYWKY